MEIFNPAAFQRRLILLRREHKLSQEALGHKILVGQRTISDWETGNSTPNAVKLLMLSNCFRVSVDFLVTGKHTRIFQ